MNRAALTLVFVSGIAVVSAHAASVDGVDIHWTSHGAGPQTLIYPMAEFHRIPDTGHFLMMEAPEAFNRLVEGFLARMQF